MVDEIFDRSYQSGRAGLNAGIDRGLGQASRFVLRGFEVLNRIQFAAPWARGSAAKDAHCA